MSGRIGSTLFLVARLEDAAADDENRADGHLARARGFLRQSERAPEVPLVARIVLPARLERATPAFGGRYSIQLSYGSAANARSGVPLRSPSPRLEPERA